jgi:hypothetical protein
MAAVDGIVLGAIAVGIVAIAAASKQSQAAKKGFDTKPVDIDSIRHGVKEGWYTATLTRLDDTPAVNLTGKLANGKDFSDSFALREVDFIALKNEGYPVVENE